MQSVAVGAPWNENSKGEGHRFHRAAISAAMAAASQRQGRLGDFCTPHLVPKTRSLIHEFLRHETSQDIRLRFFAPVKEFSHEFIASVDAARLRPRGMAFVAF